MNPVVLSSLIGGIATMITALAGIYQSKLAAMKRDLEKREAEIEKYETALRVKDEIVNELRAQRDKLQIAAELQDKIWSQIERRASHDREG